MLKQTLLAAAAAIALGGAFTTAAYAEHHESKPAVKATGDIVDVAVANGNFKTLASLLTQAGLVETLKSDGPFTVFAPTDAAFAKLPAEVVADLQKPENAEKLKTILTYHVVPGAVYSKDIAGKTLSADTAAGIKLPIDATNGVKVGGATVTAADIAASNGVIHVVDSVILPPAK